MWPFEGWANYELNNTSPALVFFCRVMACAVVPAVVCCRAYWCVLCGARWWLCGCCDAVRAVIACCGAVRVLWWRVIWCADRLLCACLLCVNW